LTVPDIKEVKRVDSTQDIHCLNSGPKVIENDFFPNNCFGVAVEQEVMRGFRYRGGNLAK
jgi:hypothetical protein